MTSERWRRVEDLFHSALDRAPNDRAPFLDLACADDRALREQVEGLLASFDDAGDFIEKPVMDDSLSSQAKASTPSESIIGHKIGNYEILSLLGAGGMGEVYLARDVRLDRQIALKILPAQFTTAGRRQLTNDAIKDRGPRWAPDGRRIAFYSNRGGTWNIWTINADGGGLRQLTFTGEAKAYFPLWSPDGKRLVYTNGVGAPFMIEVDKPWQEQTPQPLLLPTEPQVRFWVRAWSDDGLKLAGGWRRISENKLTLVSYSFATKQFEPLTKNRRG